MGATSRWRRRQAGDDSVRLRPLFADLLRDVGAVEGIRRVRYTSPHPKDMRPETFAAMAEATAVCEHLHYPLQSGSDRVLALMHRGDTAERYLARLADARATIDDLAVSTDIIVGFPGETEADFEQTLAVAAEAEYDYAYTFIFSPREGTEAASMQADFVDPAVVTERFERLRLVVERSALRRHQARVGRIEEYIVEGPSKTRPGGHQPAGPVRTSWCTSCRHARCAPVATPPSRSPAGPRTSSKAPSSSSSPSPRTSSESLSQPSELRFEPETCLVCRAQRADPGKFRGLAEAVASAR